MSDASETRHHDTGERLIFVGGAPRSGTTLVQNLLDCHPEILGAPEFLHLPDIVSLRQTLRRSLDVGAREPVDARVRELILGFFLPLWQREGTRFLSEKTPENVLVFEELAELFPSSRFVLVLRDPRATVASMLEVARRARERGVRPAAFTATLRAATDHAHQCVATGLRAAEALPERVAVVAYERLVADVESHTRRLCDFLGLAWNAAMLDPSKQTHLGQDAITGNSNDVWYDAKSYARRPESRRVDKWRDQLSAREQETISRAFADLPQLDAFGYRESHA
jgi:hypothetical protein